LAAIVLKPLWAESGIFEDQGAAIAKRDFFWPPIRALVVALMLSAGEVSFLIKSIESPFSHAQILLRGSIAVDCIDYPSASSKDEVITPYLLLA
jgi:hypothetical protein